MMHAARLSNAQPAWMLLWAKGFVFLERIQSGKEMLVRIEAMLSKLVVRFDPEQYRRESASGLAVPFEDEDDDEHEDEIENPRKKTTF